jgi:RimJ/RimL family protein N-acetyltransferase
MAFRSGLLGKGYATEAAQSVLDFAFRELKFEKIVSFTSLENLRSQMLMQKLGMIKAGNFNILLW